MSKWIAFRIIDTKDENGIEAAQKKYTLYFLVTDKMHCYKEEVDSILREEGYEDCITEKEV